MKKWFAYGAIFFSVYIVFFILYITPNEVSYDSVHPVQLKKSFLLTSSAISATMVFPEPVGAPSSKGKSVW